MNAHTFPIPAVPMAPYLFPYYVVRDCGYGKVWTRGAESYTDAEQVMTAWMREGMTPSEPGRRGGDFSIHRGEMLA
jgi:hypothetical protein